MKTDYNILFYPIDVNVLNDWIGDVEKAVILLLNAIYFNGFWRRPFPENQTHSQAFKTDARTEVPTEFMEMTSDFYYMESKQLDAKIIRLPYKVSIVNLNLAFSFFLNEKCPLLKIYSSCI